MNVMIGVDPHKGSHTATMLDRDERELRRIKVRAGNGQVGELLAWADGVGRGRGRWSRPLGWAICSPSSWSPPARRWLMCRRRWPHGCACSPQASRPKTDPNDARSVAVAALQAPSLAPVRAADHAAVCRLLVKHHTDLARWRNKLCCRLHALVAELTPGGISKEVVVNQARSLLDELTPTGAAAIERHRLALELVAEIEHLDTVLRASRTRITTAVAASETTLREVFGVGPIVAAMLIGYSGDPTRFTTAARYAAYTGTAPVQSPVAASPTGCHGAATAASITPCTSLRSPRSATATASGAASTNASSPRATRHAKRSADSSGASATSSGVISSPTPTAHRPVSNGPGQDTSGRL